MYYHATDVKDIKVLEPRGEDGLVYFSTKRENVLVYLVNAVKKFCGDNGIEFEGAHWGPYGFTEDGRMRIQEYYEGALEKTYKGVPAYIYFASAVEDSGDCKYIRDVATSKTPVKVDGVEYVPDALAAILEAEKQGLIVIARYEQMSENGRAWVKKTMIEQYENAITNDYKQFLKANFEEILKGED